MKVVVTAMGKGLEAEMDLRFGRAKGFMVVDSESGEASYLDNEQNLNAMQGAGIQAAENVVRAGAEAVVTGHCGPKAFRTLKAANVRVYLCSGGSVAEAVEKWKTGELNEADRADVDGHW